MKYVIITLLSLFVNGYAYSQCIGTIGEDINEVNVGDQVWMSENLRLTSFRNGDPIPQVTSIEQWIEYSNLGKPAWCYYGNEKKWEVFGILYNGHAIKDPRGLAPKGWHIPTISEWYQLIDKCLGGRPTGGKHIKLDAGWKGYPGMKGDFTGKNTSKMSALPGGMRTCNGEFYALYFSGYWWSSSLSDSQGWEQCSIIKCNWEDEIFSEVSNLCAGYSVRCIKD